MRSLCNRWPYPLSVLVMTVALGVCGSPSGRAAPGTSRPAASARQAAALDGSGTTVNVTSSNFSFALNRMPAPAGPVTFVLTNASPTEHDFAIRIQLLLESSPKAVIELRRAAFETDFRPDMRAFTIPTLIVHGDQDHTAPLEMTGHRTA